MVIGDIMSTTPMCSTPDSLLSSVVTMMSEHRYSCVLISDKSGLQGIITKSDVVHLFMKLTKDEAFLADRLRVMTVSEVMTQDPIFVTADTKLSDALLISRNQGLRHFPVVDEDERVIGLVTQSDIASSCLSLFERLEDDIEELRFLSLEDPLLQIGNRRAMVSDLDFARAFAERHMQSYTIALIDIDYFKNYNDHYGHQAGDEVLQVIANSIKEVKRGSDRVYRYGGDEILLLMPNTELEGGRFGAERFRSEIEKLNLTHAGSPLGFISSSIGVAESMTGCWEKAVESADKALYKAKHDGRNNVKCNVDGAQMDMPVRQSN